MSNTYFYHPDHLGSTSLVTNSYGEITQNISYIPYGEIFVEETSGGWQSPYYFNAKELDGKEKMTIDSYAGEAYSVSLGYKLLELGYSVSDDKKWHSTNIGVSGSVMSYGVTSTHSNTIVLGW